jgi:hypothetical protein
VTKRGQYIVENLRLYLRRHELIWSHAILEWQKLQLNQINTIDSNELMVLRKFKEIQEQIDKYNNIERLICNIISNIFWCINCTIY